MPLLFSLTILLVRLMKDQGRNLQSFGHCFQFGYAKQVLTIFLNMISSYRVVDVCQHTLLGQFGVKEAPYELINCLNSTSAVNTIAFEIGIVDNITCTR